MLPDGGEITSADNQTLIGDMVGSTSTTIAWTVVFPSNRTYALQVQVSGYDSNGTPCSVSQTTEVPVIPEYLSSRVLLAFMGATLLGILVCRTGFHLRKEQAQSKVRV